MKSARSELDSIPLSHCQRQTTLTDKGVKCQHDALGLHARPCVFGSYLCCCCRDRERKSGLSMHSHIWNR